MKKKDSIAWKIAKKITRRKGINKIAIELSDDGQSVKFQSLIRGNSWWVSLPELKLLEG